MASKKILYLKYDRCKMSVPLLCRAIATVASTGFTADKAYTCEAYLVFVLCLVAGTKKAKQCISCFHLV